MSRPWKPWIDWGREREALAPLLARPGGVARIQSSSSGPLMEFAQALRSHLHHGDWVRPWTTIQLDPENYATRYFGEMTRQMERSLALAASPVASIALGEGSKIGTDMQASSITIANSFNLGPSDYMQAVADEQRAQRIIEALVPRLSAESFCLLFVHSESFRRQDLELFRVLMWQRGLEAHSDNGVLLVDLTRANRRGDIEWPPSPCVDVTLADEYDAQGREEAIGDLADLLLQYEPEKSEDAARAYSRAMLDVHSSPTTLYAQLAGLFASQGIPHQHG